MIDDGIVLAEASREAPKQASQALVEMMEELLEGSDLGEFDLFVADCGPGSFIGVRVAVSLAKACAWAGGKPCAGVSVFDLISPTGTVAFPSRRGEYFIRDASGEVTTAPEPPAGAIGFGPHFEAPAYPLAANAGALWDRLIPIAPELLLPNYMIEPSISTPKTPYRTEG